MNPVLGPQTSALVVKFVLLKYFCYFCHFNGTYINQYYLCEKL